jgi:phosphoribosyl-ATP pyrophosphohydrolase
MREVIQMSGVLEELAATIHARRSESADKSYTRQLLDAGSERCARKFGEEAIEAVVAALSEDRQALISESADVLYHLLVLLESRDVAFEEVLQQLEKRSGTSGIAEKAARTSQ